MWPHLRHVQAGLSGGELVDGTGSLRFSQDGLEFGELDPRDTVLRVVLEELLVEDPTALKLSQLYLQLYVRSEQLVLRAFTYSYALQQTHSELM